MLNATILLVKDHLDDIVAVEAMVEELGYKVMAVSAVENPELFRNPESRIDLVICHNSQKVLFSEARINEAELPFILISEVNEKMVLAPPSTQRIAYLNQPFSKILLKTLIELLMTRDIG